MCLLLVPPLPLTHSTLLYELVLLGKPFKNVSRECVIWRIGSGRFQPLSLLPRDRLRGIIQRCWRLSPESRPTFKSILTDVEQNVSAGCLICLFKNAKDALTHTYLYTCAFSNLHNAILPELHVLYSLYHKCCVCMITHFRTWLFHISDLLVIHVL